MNGSVYLLNLSFFPPAFYIIAAAETIIFIFIFFLLYRKVKYHSAITGTSINRPYRIDQIKNAIFLAGDMGALPSYPVPPIVKELKCQIDECPEHSAMIFLGDNVYPNGMPPVGDPGRKRAEERLLAQLKITDGFKGKIIFISGNHDWNKGLKGGWKFVLREEKFVSQYIHRTDVFLPHNGCPGPDCVKVDDDIEIIVINTQWWVQKGFVPIGSAYGCKAQSESDFFRLLEQSLNDHKNKKLLVLGHHPLFSNSAHGGKFSTRQHLFPFTAVNPRLLLPVPLLGSVYPIYRKFIGAKEDISYPAYRRMRKKLLHIFRHFPGLVYASGHDHNLQYICRRGMHFIISGSGSKKAYVRQGGRAIFAAAVQGFIRLNYLDNGQIWMEAWRADKTFTGMIFTTRL